MRLDQTPLFVIVNVKARRPRKHAARVCHKAHLGLVQLCIARRKDWTNIFTGKDLSLIRTSKAP